MAKGPRTRGDTEESQREGGAEDGDQGFQKREKG